MDGICILCFPWDIKKYIFVAIKKFHISCNTSPDTLFAVHILWIEKIISITSGWDQKNSDRSRMHILLILFNSEPLT
jgi:hypothetical protein